MNDFLFMKFGFRHHCNFFTVKHWHYLVAHIGATGATFLCTQFEVHWLINKNNMLPTRSTYTGLRQQFQTVFFSVYYIFSLPLQKTI